jgi:hypothetical protein
MTIILVALERNRAKSKENVTNSLKTVPFFLFVNINRIGFFNRRRTFVQTENNVKQITE